MAVVGPLPAPARRLHAAAASVCDAHGTAVAGLTYATAADARPAVNRAAAAAAAWRATPIAARLAVAAHAADLLLSDTLPTDDLPSAMPAVAALVQRSTGVPGAVVMRGFAAIADELREMELTLRAASPTRELDVFHAGGTVLGEGRERWVPAADACAVIAPGNTVGVHAIWPALVVAGFPVVVRPSAADPFTPLRTRAALVAAGVPADVVGFLPLPHDAVPALTGAADAAIAFGDAATLRALPGLTRAYGPGNASCVVTDAALRDPTVRGAVVRSITEEAGRACVNASVLYHVGPEDRGLAALAADLCAIAPRPLSDPCAVLGVLPPPDAARWCATLDALVLEGAVDHCAPHRPARAAATADGAVLLPALVELPADYPAVRWEVPGPVAWVVRWDPAVLATGLPRREVLALRSLVVSAFVDAPPLFESLCAAPGVGSVHDRVRTTAVHLCDGHDGYVLDGLYRRKTVRRV